ncbi:hypothetical protein [Actinomycetospora aeridis]|uniref:Uncharacterized protein n=1 Tax=Actinomycetospora aeridis TaxID=3129231 RepID=A0ABU8N6W0_9PSEU
MPWPVAADPDAVTTTLGGPPRHRGTETATTLLPGAPAAPTAHVPGLRAVPPAAPRPSSGASALAPPPTVPPPPVAPVAPVPARPAGGPPRRAPIRRERVPGTPVAESRPVWGPPQPAR